jgi:septal ring factor EnvC (AmiA/AmiB activator)
MIVERLRTLARRGLVVGAVAAAVGIALITVDTSAQWRAATAKFDPAPADAVSVVDAAATEAGRASDLRAQLDGVAGQLSQLQAALIEASSSVNGDAANAARTRDQLAKARTRLQTLQGQLNQAQARLTALNQAAARQAALNRAAAAAPAGPAGGSTGGAAPREVDDGG